MHFFESDAVIIDQTMLCEASRLLSRAPTGEDFVRYVNDYGFEAEALDQLSMDARMRSFGNAERLLHLETLMRALILYERLYVLEGELPPDAESLPLRQGLTARRVVLPLDAASISDEIDGDLRNLFNSASSLSPHKQPGVGTLLGSTTARVLRPPRDPVRRTGFGVYRDEEGTWIDTSHAEAVTALLRGEIEGTLSHHWVDDWEEALSRNPIAATAANIVSAISYFHSGAVVGGVSGLRTFVYWRASTRFGMPFYPSFRRLPQYYAMCDHVRDSVQDSVYRIVADAFDTTVHEVYDDAQSIPIPLPPAVSIFLARLRDTGDPLEAVDGLRFEFEPLRQALASLQSEIRHGASIGDRLRAKKEVQRVLQGLMKHHRDERDTVLDELIDFAPDAISPLSNPLDPTKYSAGLIKKPVGWVRDWWFKRPFRIAFDLRKTLLGLEDFARLAKEVLGIEIDPDEFALLREYYRRNLALYGGNQARDAWP